ncbi:MAG: alanine racemase [Spirochaetia bacterium]|uniref:alanine racemase n=1 Tax=Treponema sp. TaxID=166 RepID=UPI00298DC26F|nr:alanine racemase [Treponema sp.]MCI7397152.1 alanine racemase [Spirochaetia bacterium]MCI7576644.1 alanine racemase [Spirochaetia bacterium]
MRTTKAIIHLGNLKSNVASIKKLLKNNVKMCVAIKADAYGHGAVPCAKAAVESGADYLAIATVDEGIELRTNGIKVPLLLLSLCSPEEIPDAVRYGLTPFIFDSEYIQLFAGVCRSVGIKEFPVHLAVDTGMGRIGCAPKQAGKLAAEIVKTGVLTLGGTGTHFALSDGTSKAAVKYTRNQYEEFKTAIKSIRKAGIEPGICHCSNSAATLNNPEYHMDMVRPGIICYGYYADEVSKEFLESRKIKIDLKPVMTVETSVCAIRPFAQGKSVGYGCTWTAQEDTDIAVLPVGYEDGWFRRFSKEGIKVSINGKGYPVRGRICMDQCMIELGKDHKVKRWDKAVLFGCKEDGALQTADDIARITGTIPYEITCGISKRVPRIYVD